MVQNSDSAKARRSTRQEYPEDRFDGVKHSGRSGAHRVVARPRYIWQYLIAGLLGFALLTTIGIFAVQSVGNAGKLPIVGSPKATAAPEPKVEAELDPEATIAVLNGTPTQNLAAALDEVIRAESWGQIIFSGAAASTDVKISAVFYMAPEDEAAAQGLASKLGGISTYTTTDYQHYGARLVVLLGSDYQGPGMDEAEAMASGDGNAGADEIAVDPETGNQIDPATGYQIDPETGQLIDPGTGFLIDPETGLPVDPNTGESVVP